MSGDNPENNPTESTASFIDQVNSKIRDLIEPDLSSENIDVGKILEDLNAAVKEVGVEEEALDTLLDIILDAPVSTVSRITATQKRYIIKNLLVPNQTYILKKELIYQIISSIGIPQVYYKNGRPQRVKKLPKNIQLCLLEWLVSSIHLFGDDVFNILHRMLPILFNYLSYEFLRPYIANLIFLSALNDVKTFRTYLNEGRTYTMNSFKPWQIQLVIDLYFKFPLDDHLKSLLILFKTLNPAIDFSQYSGVHGNALNDLGRVNPKVLRYPNFDYLDKLNDIEIINSSSRFSNSGVIKENLRRYEIFQSTLKDRKRIKNGHFSEPDLDVVEFGLNENEVSINDVHSFKNLIENFDNVKFISVSGLFRPSDGVSYESDRFKKFFLVLQGVSKNEAYLKKLDCYVRFSLLDENLSLRDVDSLTNKIANFLTFCSGAINLKLIVEFTLFEFNVRPIHNFANATGLELENLTQRLKFVKFLPVIEFLKLRDSFLEKVFSLLKIEQGDLTRRSKTDPYVSSFLIEIASLFSLWYSMMKVNSYGFDSKEKIYSIIRKSIPLIHQFIIDNYLSSSLEVKLALMKLFNVVKSMDPSDLENLDAKALIPKPELVYDILFCNSPFLFSELCGYVSYCKNYKFKDSEQTAKILQNSYIMDIINFFWRDKALEFEPGVSSKSRAMCLSPQFVHKLGSLNLFNYSNLISLNVMGNVFHNPCWAYLGAQIVWNLEDNQDTVTTRHMGPISENSINELTHDPSHRWLDVDYKKLKLEVLRGLDKKGFKGLGDLLFTSLVSLVNERVKSS
ncbi:uncharacterized protein PRCAT00003388001 [Priceomyces carsonii]|uniref:uncharacterized protein n=1 Tax=Priceomyces carsonii TaxID=28549 RepID=UPI002ED85920|nr:unnamed protein product [Priceomyces carsonii]